MFIKPTVEEFKTFFARDFPFQPAVIPPEEVDLNKFIQDSDVSNAFLRTNPKFNEEFFTDTQEEYTLGYLYLSAHLLVMSLRASNAGFTSSFNWGATSTSVGSVSESRNLPGNIMTNPLWAWLVSSNYGVEYLMMVIPNLIGNFGIALGRTQA